MERLHKKEQKGAWSKTQRTSGQKLKFILISIRELVSSQKVIQTRQCDCKEDKEL